MTNFLFLLLTAVEFTAALIIFAGALGERLRLYPVWHKIGLILASFGLVAQGVRNIVFIETGISPTDADLPLWALKDLGISIIAFYYFAIAMKGIKWTSSK